MTGEAKGTETLLSNDLDCLTTNAYYVSPEWAEEKKLTTIIGDHLFYR